jgi:hypothetical protein
MLVLHSKRISQIKSSKNYNNKKSKAIPVTDREGP